MNKSRFKSRAGWRATTAAGVLCTSTLAIKPVSELGEFVMQENK